MYTAKEAHKDAVDAAMKFETEELKIIEKKIRKSAKKGFCYCELDYSISEGAIKALEAIGYEVENYNNFYTDCTWIGW